MGRYFYQERGVGARKDIFFIYPRISCTTEKKIHLTFKDRRVIFTRQKLVPEHKKPVIGKSIPGRKIYIILLPVSGTGKCKTLNVKIESSWKDALNGEFVQPYFGEIVDFLKAEKEAGKIIYPPGPLIFNAFDKTPYSHVKVVILGQDPYHNPGQAHGLSFSVPRGISIPPSLVNIFKEQLKDLGLPLPLHGNLETWAEQGVLLVNTILTVRKNEPASHSKIGWMKFTDAVIKKLSDERRGIVFLLWGKFAIQKQIYIDSSRHIVLTAAHPSPFSADKGFFGCKHFSKTNDYLVKQGSQPIDWKLPE